MRKPVEPVAISILAIGVACLWLTLRGHQAYRLHVKTYFHHVNNLKPGTPVSVDGVEVGNVETVDVRPDLGGRSVEVVMAVRTAFDLRIPVDSTVRLSAQGVLGPTVVDIDTVNASGPPVESNGALKSLEVSDNQASHAMEVLGNAMIEASKKLKEKETTPSPLTDSGK